MQESEKRSPLWRSETGVREYWIVDSEKNRITVYNFEQDGMQEYSFGEDVPVGIYEGFSIRIS